MARKEKPRAVYEDSRLPDDYYDEGIKKANEYRHGKDGNDNEFSGDAKLYQWILELIKHFPRGATAWDVIQCLGRRELKPEDAIPEFARDESAVPTKNRVRAEGTIASTLSVLEAEGHVRWRNEGKLKDQFDNPIEGGEMRMGGYGVLRRVYEVVPHTEKEESKKKVAARKDADKARRLFIKQGEAVIVALQKRNATLEAFRNAIKETGIVPDYLMPEEQP